MAAELEKLAIQLKDQGYNVGGNLIDSIARALRRDGLIPDRLGEITVNESIINDGLSFGTKVRLYRARLGMSQRFLADKSG